MAESRFCAICGRQHDPGAGCADGTSQILTDSGMQSGQGSHGEFQRIAKEADRWMMKALLIFVLIAALTMVLVALKILR